ncbi:MAG: Lrp/AsnC family transcriptional regulator [Pseudomonadota bacterium]
MIDDIDRKILRELQSDCSKSIAELADKVGLSKSACHRRVKILEDSAIIDGYRASLRPKAVGYELSFYVGVRLKGQSDREMGSFEKKVLKIPEVVSCRLMTGQTDYLLYLLAADADDYERIHHRLARIEEVANLESSLVLRDVSGSSSIPV